MSLVDSVAEGMGWQHLRAVVLHRDRYMCQICHEAMATEADHIWPKSKGGPDTMENLQAACKPCNRAKSDRGEFAIATRQQHVWWNEYRAQRVRSLEAEIAYGRAAVKLLQGNPEAVCVSDLTEMIGLTQEVMDELATDELNDMKNPHPFLAVAEWASERGRMADEAVRP